MKLGSRMTAQVSVMCNAGDCNSKSRPELQAVIMSTVATRPLHASYERGCQAKTLLHCSPGDLDRCLHPGPFFLMERILVLTPAAPQSTTGIRIAVAGLP